MTRTLVLVRHAKAEPFAESDHDRPLAERGLRDARALGEHLHEAGITPEVVLVSSALRTQQTFEQVVAGAGWEVTPWIDTTLYAAGTDTVLELVHALPAETGTVVVIGHNPTIALLAQLLDDGQGETVVEVRPGTAIILDLAVGWEAVDAGTASVRAVWAP